MTTWLKMGCGLMFVGLLVGTVRAQEEDSIPEEDVVLAATATAVTGKVEKVGVDGTQVVLEGKDLGRYQIRFDEPLTIPDDGGLWLSLSGQRGTVHLSGGAKASFVSVRVDEQLVSLGLRVEHGRATMISRVADHHRLVLAAGAVGFALLRGGAVTVEVSDRFVTLSAHSGEVLAYRGALPAAVLTAAGEPARPADATLAPGERISLSDMAKSSADSLPASGVGEMYAMGLGRASVWIAEAEKGDFTPQRVEARGGEQFSLERTSTDFAFDQARPPVALATPGVTSVVQNVRLSPAEALLASRNPASVVVGVRLEDTRFTGGGRGGSSSITFNPSARQRFILGP